MYEPSWTERELRSALDQYEAELRHAGKARNTIATYVQHPERFINWLVGHYRPAPRLSPRGGSSSRYEPLREYLASRSEPAVRMTFGQIEEVLSAPLPPSARKYRPWWANERAGTHVHARAWLDAGRRTTDVDLDTEVVTFRR
jgi:hypothetical protein